MMQNITKSAMRTAKNSIKGYSDAQTKVREATSNDPWGPSGTQMSEIAAMTFDQQDFVEIMEMLDKRLNDKGKNWRHVFKSLTLIDYLLHAGSENTVVYFRENLYLIKTLKEFQYIDDHGKDVGANVRQKAKDITSLLLDENRMSTQRKTRSNMQDRLSGRPPSANDRRPTTSNNTDNDLQAAIEASKRSAEEEARRGKKKSEDDELAEALRLSREEEERRKALESQRGGSLFDDMRENNDNLIDIDGATAVQQMPQMTGFASYNPYAQMQMQQQEEWMRQQQMMELQRQADEANYQAMLQQQAFAEQQRLAQEEYMRQMAMQQQYMQQQQQPLVPQMTAFGSNNPFAAFASNNQQEEQPKPQPVFTPPPQQASTPKPPSPVATPQPAPSSSLPNVRRPKDDGKHAALAQMLAAGREDGGVDTFGNVGRLRFPAHHTGAAAGGRVGLQGTIAPQVTGKPNPFQYQQPQATGYPQRHQQQQQQQQSNGGGSSSSNPFFDL